MVVPGGGALADEVRICQRQLGLADGAAHRMALLAMDQLAWAVAGLRLGFEVGDTEEALRRSLEQGHVAVWAPFTLVANRRDIPQSWTVTSDSLALWLGAPPRRRARVMSSNRSQRPRAAISAEQLARDGVVDAAFPAMLREAGLPTFLLGRGDQAAFAASLGLPGGACGAPSTKVVVLSLSADPRACLPGRLEVGLSLRSRAATKMAESILFLTGHLARPGSRRCSRA